MLEKTIAAILAAALAATLIVVAFTTWIDYQDCTALGGVLVRGLTAMECVRR